MQVLATNAAALCIAMLYYAWRDSALMRHQRAKTLRERVAYMLWVAANNQPA